MDTNSELPPNDLKVLGEEELKKIRNNWRDFYLRQPVVITEVNPKELIDLKGQFYVCDDEPLFAVYFPKSWNHVHDFLQNVETATAVAIFGESGHVNIQGIGKNDQRYNYKSAWEEIYLRVMGFDANLIEFKINPEHEINIDTVIKNSNELTMRITNCLEKLNQIPGVKAEKYEGDNGDSLIEVDIPMSAKHLLDPDNAGADVYCVHLTTENKVDFDHYEDGERSAVFEEWIKGEKEIKTWQQLYDGLLKLANSYAAVIEIV